MNELHDKVLKRLKGVTDVSRLVYTDDEKGNPIAHAHGTPLKVVAGDILEEIIEAVKEKLDERANPYPEDIFVPLSKEDLKNIHELLESRLGIPLDRVTGHIGRYVFNIRKQEVIEALDQLKQTNEQCDFCVPTIDGRLRCILDKGHKSSHEDAYGKIA